MWPNPVANSKRRIQQYIGYLSDALVPASSFTVPIYALCYFIFENTRKISIIFWFLRCFFHFYCSLDHRRNGECVLAISIQLIWHLRLNVFLNIALENDFFTLNSFFALILFSFLFSFHSCVHSFFLSRAFTHTHTRILIHPFIYLYDFYFLHLSTHKVFNSMFHVPAARRLFYRQKIYYSLHTTHIRTHSSYLENKRKNKRRRRQRLICVRCAQ